MIMLPRPIKRPLYELKGWLSPYQQADEAAHELIGRTITAYGKIEYLISDLCLRLASREEYCNIRTSYPGFMKGKIDFLRQCLASEPLKKYAVVGNRLLDRVKNDWGSSRMRHAHSHVRVDLMRSHDGTARFSQLVIDQEHGKKNIAVVREQTLSIDDLLADFRSAQRLEHLVSRCHQHLARSGIASPIR